MKKGEHKEEKGRARGVGGFMSGVLVLSFSTVLVKIIGLAVKIPMLAVLGAEGMGYFSFISDRVAGVRELLSVGKTDMR